MMETPVGYPPIQEVLSNRRWELRSDPFPHYRAMNVFSSIFYESLEAELRSVLARGLSERVDASRFSKNMKNSDAYGWNFPPGIDGPLSLFFSLEWHAMLAGLTGIPTSLDVNGALHHHQLRSLDGKVHRDLGVGWFSSQKRPDGINPMDLDRCSYTQGKVTSPGIQRREMVRAVTMIFYLGNAPWQCGDGGETALYRKGNDPVRQPAATVPPVNNSLLVFENTPDSWHSFLQNRRAKRNSAILWLHRSKAEMEERWRGQVSNW